MFKQQVQVTFTEPVLGGVPLADDLVEGWIANSAPDDATAQQEVESSPDVDEVDVDEQLEKQTTGFHRFDGTPGVYDYHIIGFLKSACKAMRRVDDTLSEGVKAYKKKFADLWFISPRRIQFESFDPEDMFIMERPLRASTAQGERVSLARSEAIPAGATLTFEVKCLQPDNDDLLEEWLDYGELKGLGQWRNAGWGRFKWECIG